MNFKWLSMAVLVFAVTSSAMSVVNSKHQSRKAFVELRALQAVRDEMQVNWGRLQLEQAAWSTHGRVEHIATSKLEMQMPGSRVEIVQP
ncbi:MAG: cell division protein FtsL [Gammaproteobacteria bacterium]|nr:cell division protein FtsL [Gammaproteobacteria bacterium]MDH5800064.1 cell division protein FtsL [Gammaproteobacteria bacterium]